MPDETLEEWSVAARPTSAACEDVRKPVGWMAEWRRDDGTWVPCPTSASFVGRIGTEEWVRREIEARGGAMADRFRVTPLVLLRTPRGEGEARRAECLRRRAYYDEETTLCLASRDGDCDWPDCPQTRDNEPHATGRHCPLDTVRFDDAQAALAALRSEAQGEDEDSLVKEAVALIDEAVSEIAGDCQCYEEDGEVVVCWTCRAMNWSDCAARTNGGSDG